MTNLSSPVASASLYPCSCTPFLQQVASKLVVALAAIALVTGTLTFIHLHYGISIGGIGALSGMGIQGALALAGGGGGVLILFILWTACQKCRTHAPGPSTQFTEEPPIEPLNAMDTTTKAASVPPLNPFLAPIMERKIFQLNPSLDTPRRCVAIQTGSDLEEEFIQLNATTSVEEKDPRCSMGQNPLFSNLNRYQDIFPFDQWAFRLHDPSGDLPFDTWQAEALTWSGLGTPPYINASRMGSHQTDILTQGPREHAIPHFWKMVWGSHTSTIVMLTLFKEGEREKCAKYFPEEAGEEIVCEQIRVKLMEEKSFEGGVTRIFQLTQGAEVRTCFHLQCLEWGDSQPYPAAHLKAMIEQVDHQAQGQPIVAHCSAGVGRAGTFYACYLIYQGWKQGGLLQVHVLELMKYLRSFRPHLVQRIPQYQTIFEFIETLNT